MPNDIGQGIREWADGDEVRLNGLALATSVRDALIKLGLLSGDTYLRDQILGVPANPAQQLALQGQLWKNTELGYTQCYYAQYDANNNKSGAIAPGWYYHSGPTPTINRRQSTMTSPGATETLIPWNLDIEYDFPGLDYSGGYFIAARPMRVLIEYTLNFSGGGTGGIYANSFLRKSTRSALGTTNRAYKFGERVDNVANTNRTRNLEISMNTDEAFSVASVMSTSGGGTITAVDDGARVSTYIMLRESPRPPKFNNW